MFFRSGGNRKPAGEKPPGFRVNRLAGSTVPRRTIWYCRRRCSGVHFGYENHRHIRCSRHCEHCIAAAGGRSLCRRWPFWRWPFFLVGLTLFVRRALFQWKFFRQSRVALLRAVRALLLPRVAEQRLRAFQRFPAFLFAGGVSPEGRLAAAAGRYAQHGSQSESRLSL